MGGLLRQLVFQNSCAVGCVVYKSSCLPMKFSNWLYGPKSVGLSIDISKWFMNAID